MVIGYTTGVFDMFHIGHLNLIKKAKERCDYLIVGVSTDEIVLSYKHKRPVIPFEQRVQIVEALRYVDRVVAQTSMNKLDAWNDLHFNVLFHGSDWKNTDMYRKVEENMKQVGVQVVFLPHTEGVSSTMLVEKIRNQER